MQKNANKTANNFQETENPAKSRKSQINAKRKTIKI